MEYSVIGCLEINNLGVLKDNRCKIRFIIIKNNRKLPISDYSCNNLPDTDTHFIMTSSYQSTE